MLIELTKDQAYKLISILDTYEAHGGDHTETAHDLRELIKERVKPENNETYLFKRTMLYGAKLLQLKGKQKMELTFEEIDGDKYIVLDIKQ